MKKQLLVLLSITLLTLTSCQEKKTTVPTLEGEIAGTLTKYLILQYSDSLGNYSADTIFIENNKFSIENPVRTPHKVALSSNLTGEYMEDPNRSMFFLDPGNVTISLKEGEFSQAKISGSATQRENEKLTAVIKPYYEKIEKLMKQREELIARQKGSDENNLDQKIDSLSQDWRRILKEIDSIQLEYAYEHNDSFVSADIISFYKRSIAPDSLLILYNNLTPTIKGSFYGNAIKEQIELYVADSGDRAPDFSGKNFDGREISLNQFNGKVVLLDFMAGWCIPCIKNHPQIKELYATYNPRGLEIISVSFDRDEETWKENVIKEELNWNHIYQGLDNIGKEGSISKLYTVRPIPAYILINEKGIIINRYSGADKNGKNLDDLENDLQELFAESKTLVRAFN
jgi:peroxiredoxin